MRNTPPSVRGRPLSIRNCDARHGAPARAPARRRVCSPIDTRTSALAQVGLCSERRSRGAAIAGVGR
jgi:hypothetical protein